MLSTCLGVIFVKQALPDILSFFPFWKELNREQQADLLLHGQLRKFQKCDMIIPYEDQCLGLVLVRSGQLRAFVLSDSGKEVTLYRLYELDICLFSASCIMSNIQFTIQIEVEKDTSVLLVPSTLYDRLMQQSIAVANYTIQLMASRFSDVMWALEQVLFKSMDCRLAQVLLEHAAREGTNELSLTHEAIARDLGSAREVVTRMLKYFREEGLVELTRGRIQLMDQKRLQTIANR